MGKAAKIISLILFLLTLAPVPASAEEPIRLDLEGCIGLALERNKDILAAKQEVVKTYARIDENEASAYPEINASADYTRIGNISEFELNGEMFSFTPEDNYKLDLNLSQKIYAPQVFEAIKASKSFAKTSEFQLETVKAETVNQVSKLYYRLLLSKELIRINEASVLQLKRHVQDVKKRFETGLSTDFDLLRAEVQLANAMPDLARAKNENEIAEASLKIVLGIEPASNAKIDGKLLYLPFNITFEDAISSAMARRPEIDNINYTIETLEIYSKIAKKEALPTLTMHGDIGYANNDLAFGGQAKWDYQWNVGVSLDYKLYDGGKRSSKVVGALSDLTKARIDRERLFSTIHLEVKTAFGALEEANELIASQSKSIEKAQRAFEIAEVRNKNGLMTQLELLDAQLALTSARINYSRAVYEYLLALTNLKRAMGTILEEAL